MEKEIVTLKQKNTAAEAAPSKKLLEQRKINDELQEELNRDKKRYSDLTGKYEQLEEEHVLIKAQLTADKEKAQSDLSSVKGKLTEVDSDYLKIKKEKADLTNKINELTGKVNELENKLTRSTTVEHEKNRLKATLQEREQDLDKIKNENEMNKDVCGQLKREVVFQIQKI